MLFTTYLQECLEQILDCSRLANEVADLVTDFIIQIPQLRCLLVSSALQYKVSARII